MLLAERCGATRMVLGTSAIEEPTLVEEAIRKWGEDRIVVAIEVKNGKVVTDGWQSTSGMDPLELGHRMYAIGVRIALYTNVLKEGMLQGVDIPGSVSLARETGLKVIASGGGSRPG